LIICQLTGADTATACGLTVRGNTPVLSLCRKLIDAGHDPDIPLQAFRGDTLCLKLRSIGEAARLRINSKGTGFIVATNVRTAPPMRPMASGGQFSFPASEFASVTVST
jgi:hypothetical protein